MSNPAEGDKRKIAVFIASPGDLAVERRAFRACVDELNVGFGDGAGVEFEALGWEDTLASTGRRTQGGINAEIDRCDVFILTMHVRWGKMRRTRRSRRIPKRSSTALWRDSMRPGSRRSLSSLNGSRR